MSVPLSSPFIAEAMVVFFQILRYPCNTLKRNYGHVSRKCALNKLVWKISAFNTFTSQNFFNLRQKNLDGLFYILWLSLSNIWLYERHVYYFTLVWGSFYGQMEPSANIASYWWPQWFQTVFIFIKVRAKMYSGSFRLYKILTTAPALLSCSSSLILDLSFF